MTLAEMNEKGFHQVVYEICLQCKCSSSQNMVLNLLFITVVTVFRKLLFTLDAKSYSLFYFVLHIGNWIN